MVSILCAGLLFDAVWAQPLSPWDGTGKASLIGEHHVAACTACHGPQGRATPSGYFPRIAGKPQEYLYQQLLNYRDGRRSYPLMGHLLRHLDNDQLQGMARYFSQLSITYPAPDAKVLAESQKQRGAALVQQGDKARGVPACVACHGRDLMGVLPAVPGLLGLSRDYLNSQLGAWQVGRRSAKAPDCMAIIASKLQPQDVADISSWLSTQHIPEGGKPSIGHEQSWPLACGAAPHVPGAGQELTP